MACSVFYFWVNQHFKNIKHYIKIQISGICWKIGNSHNKTLGPHAYLATRAGAEQWLSLLLACLFQLPTVPTTPDWIPILETVCTSCHPAPLLDSWFPMVCGHFCIYIFIQKRKIKLKLKGPDEYFSMQPALLICLTAWSLSIWLWPTVSTNCIPNQTNRRMCNSSCFSGVCGWKPL